MASRRSSLLSTLFSETIPILTPVTLTILLSTLLTTTIPPSTILSSSSSSPLPSTLPSAILVSLAFVAFTTLLTFLVLLLFYLRLTRFLRFYLLFSTFFILSLFSLRVTLPLRLRLDAFSFFLILLNFAVVGTIAVSTPKSVPFKLRQVYLVVIAVLVAYWFSDLPAWTSWVMLVAISVYDVAAVLLPVGPLRLLVEMAIERDEELPALIYEARPMAVGGRVRRWRRQERRRRRNGGLREALVQWTPERMPGSEETGEGIRTSRSESSLASLVERQDGGRDARSGEIRVDPELGTESVEAIRHSEGTGSMEGIRHSEGTGSTEGIRHSEGTESRESSGRTGVENGDGSGGRLSSGGIKLGLGDFIFYSVLVARAATYDFMEVYACYLAIVAGLGVTLLLLAIYRKALPALPMSIGLGLLFYVLTRFLLEAFVMQCSVNLVMF